MQAYSRDELLQLTPDRYLADGYLNATGAPRPELRDAWASAACNQFLAAELPPQELAFTIDALKLILPERDETEPGDRLHVAVQEALETVARAIQQRNNEGLLRWLTECVRRVDTEADLQAFLEHFEAVRKQYAVLVALLPSSAG